MTLLSSRLNTESDEFQANMTFMEAYVEKIRSVERNIRASEERYRARAEKRVSCFLENGWRICWIQARLF